MCDYSLMAIPNRLAVEGDSLETYRFSTGSIGLASPESIRHSQSATPAIPDGFWERFWAFFTRPQHLTQVEAVCIPPGARLSLTVIPGRVQRRFHLAPTEEVTFTQVTAAWNYYRDALRLSDGREILLQEIGEGLSVRVLSLELAEPRQPIVEEHYQYSLIVRPTQRRSDARVL